MSGKRIDTLPSFEIGDQIFCDTLGVLPGAYAVVTNRKKEKMPNSPWNEWRYTARIIFRDYHTNFNEEDFTRDDGLKVISFSKKDKDEYISFLGIEVYKETGEELEDLGFVKV